MQIKTDTKEKFHVITVKETALTASMTEDLTKCLLPYLQNMASLPDRQVKNLVLVLKETSSVERSAAETLVSLQQQFYDAGASFVICELQPQVEEQLDKEELLEIMNVTPTESEAWDIVQMEEIEREMFGDES
jgi:MFS superfamily sulfate permease-like transporter